MIARAQKTYTGKLIGYFQVEETILFPALKCHL
jgi:hypothetical protein